MRHDDDKSVTRRRILTHCPRNFKLISRINILSNSCEITLRWMPQEPTDGNLKLVQVMAWCRQAISHRVSKRRPRSLSPYGIPRPQWVKEILSRFLGSISPTIFPRSSNSIEIWYHCYHITGHHIAMTFCTCHDSTIFMPCTKFGSDIFIKIWTKFPSSLNSDG